MTQPTNYRAALEQAQGDEENLRKALRFYAAKWHFNLSDDTAWDTVSGEPQNFWCDEAGTATVEDGSIAALALTGVPINWEDGVFPPTLPNEATHPQASEPAPSTAGEADRLYDAIKECMLHHRLQSFMGEDGEHYPLVDHLSPGQSIEDGKHEIDLICDSIYNTVLKPAALLQSTALPDHSEQHLDMVAVLAAQRSK